MIGDIIANFPRGTFTRYRRVAQEFVRGRATPGSVTITTGLRAVCVPTTGRDLLRLPEGLRTKETKRVFAAVADFDIRGLEGDAPPDELAYAGDFWEVATVSKWDEEGAFRDVLIQKKYRSPEQALAYFGPRASAPTLPAEIQALQMKHLTLGEDVTLFFEWPSGQPLIYAEPFISARPFDARTAGATPEDDEVLTFTQQPGTVTIASVPYVVHVSTQLGDGDVHTVAIREVLP